MRGPELIPKNPTIRLYPKDYGIFHFIAHSDTGIGGLADVLGFIGDLDTIEDFLHVTLEFVKGCPR